MLSRMYIALGRGSAATRCRWSRRARARRPASSRPRSDQGRERLRLAQDRSRACTAWCASRLTTPTRAATPASPACGSIPVVDDNIEIDIKESDCRIDTYIAPRAPAASTSTRTDSAVRITHIPTNIVVASQQERSQIKNRAIAWAMLKSRLYELELKKREEKANAEAGRQDRHRLGPPDPLLRAAALPAGEGPAHRHPEHRPRRPCSTATSTRSSRRRWRSA